MNILNVLRKPFASIFLAVIVLTFSCSRYEDKQVENLETMDFSSYVAMHLELSSQLADELNKNKNLREDLLLSVSNNDDMIYLLKTLNYTNSKRILNIIDKMKTNTNAFFDGNEGFIGMDVDVFQNKITDEIRIQNSKIEYQKRLGPCEDAFDNATENCLENAAISTAIAVASGFLSFGVTTAYALAGVTIVMLKCMADAEEAYNDCED